MKLKTWATLVAWLGLVLFIGLADVKLLDRKTRKWKSKVPVKRVLAKSSQSHRRHNNRHTHFSQHFSGDDFEKRQVLEINSRTKSSFASKVIARSSSPTLSYATVGKLRRSFMSYPRTENQNKPNQRRRKIPDNFNVPLMPGLRDSKVSDSAGRDEDGLIKRSRNRVRLKTQRTHRGKMDSSNGLTPKQNDFKLDSEELFDASMPKDKKRQHISGGITYTNRPIVFGNENTDELSNEQLAENPDSFFADPMAARPNQRALHSSHFYAPAVHKYLPVEHRYPSAPIHRYLSSPVIFKDANKEGNPAINGVENSLEGRAVTGLAGPFGGAAMPPFLQASPHRGHRIIVINRPFNTPVPVPVNGPPRVVLVHHPVPLPPQRVPVPVMPRPPPYVIVHHKEFSPPCEF